MSRYRPPRPPSAPYITAAGAAALKSELDELWRLERPKVTDAVREAAKNGDRSENGDYIYGKKRLREIDSRVRYLTKRLESVKVISAPPAELHKVFFGASVTLEDEAGSLQILHIVGADEIDPKIGKISIDAPISRALLGKRVDDEVEYQAPAGPQVRYITHISYQLIDGTI
ncbi:MAG: transcription elongation factor GreB [Halieaceae bacterium]|nr:transcription elongation factor GreB [Halieaceae bacterium]